MWRSRRAVTTAAAALLPAFLPPAAPALAAQTLDDLRAPASPAFTVLGIPPTAIERPTTPRQLGFALLSATNEGTVVPDDFAVEVAPYWMTPRPELTFRDRYEPSFWQSVKQSLAVSVATDRTAGDGDDPVRLGFGVRTLPFPGRPAPRASALLDSVRVVLRRVGDLGDEINRLERRLAAERDAGVRSALAAELEELRTRHERLDERGTRLTDEIRRLDYRRSAGIRMEVAAAVASSFPGGGFEGVSATTRGVWATLSLRPAGSALDVLATLRYQRLDLPATPDAPPTVGGAHSQDLIDAGGRVLLGSGDVRGSVELIGRFAADVDAAPASAAEVGYDTTYRLAGMVEYEIFDDVALTWTLGRNFELGGAGSGNLLSLLGLELGLGRSLDQPL